MAEKNKIAITKLAKQTSKIKVNKRLDSLEDTPFFKKKMKKGEKILSVAGLPKD